VKTDRERRPLFVKRRGTGLFPVAGEDAELLSSYPMDAELEITVKRRRSLPQLRLYWSILHKTVEATEQFASAEHLHEAIKARLGYVRRMRLIGGSEVLLTDSTALAKMDAQEFGTYFDRAMKLICETFGFDPLKDMAA
jgi:hypothetical protein